MYQHMLQLSTNSLQTLSSDELRELLSEDGKLDERVNEVVKQLESSKDVILAENRSIAEASLAFEPKMVELRSRVQELSGEGQLLGQSVKEKITQLRSQSDKVNSETVLALLQTASAESEEESENVVKQFLGGDLSVDAYLEQFMGTRITMHNRKIKAEKMTELLRTRPTESRYYGAGFGLSLGPYVPPVAPTGFYNPPSAFGSAVPVPYPTGPQSVPNPMVMFRSPHF